MSSAITLLHPAYFGSIAMWSAIVKSQNICFEACDNYQKQTYRNRMYIAHSNGRLGLNIPVKHNKTGHRQKTSEVQIENNFRWQRDHWRSLEAGYRSSPFFEYYEDELKPFFEVQHNNLFQHNLASMQMVAELLEVELGYSLTEKYEHHPLEVKDHRALVLSKNTREIEMPTYHQVHQSTHGFLPNLSILDLVFNLGPESLSYLEGIAL